MTDFPMRAIALVLLLAGVFATLVTPKEEEPQIDVTMANVLSELLSLLRLERLEVNLFQPVSFAFRHIHPAMKEWEGFSKTMLDPAVATAEGSSPFREASEDEVGELVDVENFFSKQVGDRNFRGRNQKQIFLRKMKEIVRKFWQLTGSCHSRPVDEHGGQHFRIPVFLNMAVQHEVGQCALKSCQCAFQHHEAGA